MRRNNTGTEKNAVALDERELMELEQIINDQDEAE